MATVGSFGQNTPAFEAIQRAIQRRSAGGSTPALDQQSQVSATPAPLPADPSGGVAPTGGTTGGNAGVPTELGVGPQIANPEAELILKALQQRLSTISAIEKAQNVPQTA